MRILLYKLKRAHSSLWIEVVDVMPHVSLWRFNESTQLIRALVVIPSAASEFYFHNALPPLPNRI
jgi:hypothetical protein